MSSIPKPDGLSMKNLQAAMGLDRSHKAKTYYSKIRVGTLVETFRSLTDSLEFQLVVRGHMSEWHWMDWSRVSDNQKKALFNKVSEPNAVGT